MDSLAAFARGEAARGFEQKVFDWDKAATLIRERKPDHAAAGLGQDWEWTGGRIFEDGKPLAAGEIYVYLASTWAIPELEIDGEVVECYRMRSDTPGWDAGTYWPSSALKILGLQRTTAA